MVRRWLRAVHQFTEEAYVALGLRWSRLICSCGARSPRFMSPRRAVRWVDRHASESPNCFRFFDAKEVD